MLLASLNFVGRCIVPVANRCGWRALKAVPTPPSLRSLAVVPSPPSPRSLAVSFSTSDVKLWVDEFTLDAADDPDARAILNRATDLIRGALPLAQAELERFEALMRASIVAEIDRRYLAQMHILGLVQVLAALELPKEEQLAKRASIPKLQATIASANRRIERWTDDLDTVSSRIDDARVFVAHSIDCRHAALPLIFTLQQLAHLCKALLKMDDKLEGFSSSRRQWLRGWLIRVDELFTALCPVIPRFPALQFSRSLHVVAFETGALQIMPSLNRYTMSAAAGVELHRFCLSSDPHDVCHQPYLQLLVYGLDPTMIPQGSKRSAVQMARKFVREHPPAPVDAVEAAMHAAIILDKDRSIPSLIFARAIKQRASSQGAERDKRAARHARFMHALIPAWRDHSTKVHGLLMEAAPGRLIYPLVAIVSAYLDLEFAPVPLHD